MAEDGKPRVLVLGGMGFVGRHLVKHLVDQELVSYVKVADKTLPVLAYLSEEHKAAYDSPLVKVVQADLAREQHVRERVFEGPEAPFDAVFNLCGETRCGLAEQDYEKKTLEPARVTSAEAERTGARSWVELSTAQVYESSARQAAAEDAKVAPWTLQATYRHRAEEAVRAHAAGLPAVVLRAALVYGAGDLTSLAPRLACAAVYQRLGEKMKLLWDKELRINAVHVHDVVRAMWLSACGRVPAGTVLNLADAADLSQGSLNDVLARLFGIKTGFHGALLSNVAKLHLGGVAETANEKHVPAWFDLCAEHKIDNTPVSPFVDKELMRRNHLRVDGRRAADTIPGFAYEHEVGEDELRAQVEAAIRQGLFPPVLR